MRYLVVSDMHANWDAFEAVLAHSAKRSYDAALVLGDLVGYGASPNEVVAAVRSLSCPVFAIRGNHDKVAVGIESGMQFNPTALRAARWTAEVLEEENAGYVRDLPRGPIEVEPGLAICHGSPRNEDEYLLSLADVRQVFKGHPAPVTFFGHTHVPSVFVLKDGEVGAAVLTGAELSFDLEPDARYLINPGSVGQPRDQDWRGAYMVYDTGESRVELRRVGYPVERAQQRIAHAELPQILAHRLSLGV